MGRLELTQYLEKKAGYFRAPDGTAIRQGLVGLGVRITHRSQETLVPPTPDQQPDPDSEATNTSKNVTISPDAIIAEAIEHYQKPLRVRFPIALGKQRKSVMRAAHYWCPDED